MNFIAVDDERIMLARLTDAIEEAVEGAKVFSFMTIDGVESCVIDNIIEVAFLDIRLNGADGIALARRIKELSPKTNIVFCTGYGEYSLQAFDIYASGYILKPITAEKITAALENLRYPIESETSGKRIRFNCFGNFGVYCDGKPIKFSYTKTEELLAYVVDKHGAFCSLTEIDVNIFDGGEHSSYLRNLKSDLLHTFQQLGVEDVIIFERGRLGINVEKVECDYYDLLDGKRAKSSFYGKYMEQYPWAILK